MPETDQSPPRAGRGLRRFLALLLGLSLCGFGGSTPAATPKTPPKDWEKLTGCRLRLREYHDGDSYHITHQKRDLVFRLYYVDTPESDASVATRVYEQAAYFGLTPQQVLQAGDVARRASEELLAGKSFTLWTRWQNALGHGKVKRHYAVLLHKKENIALELVRYGWARPVGVYPAVSYDGGAGKAFMEKLYAAEAEAFKARAGIWRYSRLRAPPDHSKAKK